MLVYLTRTLLLLRRPIKKKKAPNSADVVAPLKQVPVNEVALYISIAVAAMAVLENLFCALFAF